MKVYRDLRLRGLENNLAALIVDIERSLKGGWRRNQEKEKWQEEWSGLKSYCFECDQSEDREAGSLHIYPQAPESPGVLEVTNIVPSRESGRLTIDEYNRILVDFHDNFIQRIAADHSVVVELTPDQVEVTWWLSVEAAEKLERFSVCANKSTGSAHPCDERRWYEFLITAHAEKSDLTTGNLRRWLEEEQGWNEQQARELASEYESARSLLNFYDEYKGT